MQPTLVYDAGCGPCTGFARIVSLLDVNRTLGFSSIQSADSEGLLQGVPWDLRYRSFHLILPDGEAKSGAQALPDVCGYFLAGRLMSRVASAPGLSAALTFTYDVLSRKHDAGPCGVPPARPVTPLHNPQKGVKSSTASPGP